MRAFLLVVVLAIAELYVIVQVAHHIGVLPTIALLVVISASGPWLVRRTGLGVWRRARARMAQGERPGRELVDGLLLLAAGVLLTIPGFLTGIAGLLLLLPPVRALVRLALSRWWARRVVVQVWDGLGRGPDGGVIPAGTRDRPPPATPPRSLESAAGDADGERRPGENGPGRRQPG